MRNYGESLDYSIALVKMCEDDEDELGSSSQHLHGLPIIKPQFVPPSRSSG